MKRYVFLFFMSMLLFVLQTTLFHQFSLGNIEPNLILILTAISGFMYGRKMGMFTGVLCGLMMDLLYSNVIGLSILLFAVIGYLNGMVTKFYYKEEIFVPMISIGVSDVMYGILFYITNYLLRGRLDFLHYF
jgi:rod shape-determining protein MreD